MCQKFYVKSLLIVLVGAACAYAAQASVVPKQVEVQKLFNEGNYKEAYDDFRRRALLKDANPREVGTDLLMALNCLQRLNRVNEIDAFRDEVIAQHADNWRLLKAAAQSLQNGPHYGFMIAGEFERGQHRGGGQHASSQQRDRVRALQLMQQAMPLLDEEISKPEVAQFYRDFANMILQNRRGGQAWRLQYLTDLTTLPDYEVGGNRYGYGHGGGSSTQGAAVDAEGKPVFYHVPESYAASQSDGERWRWLLSQVIELAPQRRAEINTFFAQFLREQFGVTTLARYSGFFGQTDDEGDESGTYALHTLKETETIARLATGIKRFSLPDEFNFIKIYQSVAAMPEEHYADQALVTLAQLFSDRRQYDRSAEYWQESLERFPNRNGLNKKQKLAQIVDNWGMFDTSGVQPARTGATIDYRFRNGKRLQLTAYELRIPELLADVKKYITDNPQRLDYNKMNIDNIGYRIVQQNERKYLGKQVANWSLDLEPRENHFDKRITITTPLQKAGAYLLTAKLEDGNVSRIIVWLDDTVIAKKQLNGEVMYYVADAVTGKPIPKANLEFFGFRQEAVKNRRNQFRVLTKNFAEFTNENGIVTTDAKRQPRDYTWLVTARTKDGRFAYYGFNSVWYGQYYDQQYNQTKVFTITDRPVYRPDQKVEFKFWVRHAQYDQADRSDFANQEFTVQITDGRGQKVFEEKLKSDAYGGIVGEYSLPKDATLGAYQLQIVGHGGGSFRVEEYKKPEFEVTVEAPDEPVMLGEKITAKIVAKYYFGAPVTNGMVKYKVLRSKYSQQWYPPGIWDWFYGPGYWWFGYDYTWFPGWNDWGCRRPVGWWWPARHDPPEVVLGNEVEIGEDGTVSLEIDTALAKEIHGNSDHRYEITAEVVDESRRTIVGKGKVLVARKPFKVFTWLDRGYYRVGDDINASFSAHTLDNKPVQGTGKLTLYRVTYDDKNEPVETVEETWDVNTNDEGKASQKIAASRAGQFRLSYKLTDAAGHEIEGAYVFIVRGDGFDGRQFRFNDIEIITDKREYKPGETVRMALNTNRSDATVLLFLRPTNGVYLPPQVIRMDGKSTVVDVTVVQKDMPNFFVEAMTISDAKIHTGMREVIVPPEKRVLNVDVTPSAESYKPGEPAKVSIKLTDTDGEPFMGSTVLSIYDKSVEYISGGSNVPEIKAFFWKWRRRHTPQTESNLTRYFGNMLKPKEVAMQFLGAFGATVVDELADSAMTKRGGDVRARVGLRQGRSMAKSMAAPAAARMEASEGLAMADAIPNESGSGETGDVVEPTVRSNFADTALWVGTLETDKNGMAEVTLDMPENLTAWKIRSWAMGQGTKVGQGESEVVTAKNLLVRLQAPRFFMQNDEVVLSANVHNYLEQDKSVRVELELDGDTLRAQSGTTQTITVPAGGDVRVDWRVRVINPGEATVRVKALTDEESDAMQMKFPVYVHGMLKMESFSGALRPDETSGKFTIDVPEARRINESILEIRYSPSLAGAMVDALPYLINYPYKTTESTLNRFLPAVITQNILLRMKLNLKDIREKRTNLNAQEIGDDAQRAEQWKRFDVDPVFDEDLLREIVAENLQALTEMQLSDGGWGWFSGWGEHSYPHTTASVVRGLQLAKANDVALVPGMYERGVEWLKRYQDQQIELLKNAAAEKKPYKTRADNLDALVYMVLVDADIASADMREFLYRDRTKLSVYGMALFGLALEKQQQAEQLAMIMRNIEQYLVEDDENQTAYLNLPNGGYWWSWYGSEFEAHAMYLKLLARTEPKSRKASRLVKYLLNNRKHATYWNSTRDTALCVEALADYMVASGEDRPDMTVEIYYDGEKQKEVKIDAENLFSFDNKVVLVGDAITTGRHTIELRKKGTGPLYFNGYLTTFTLEKFIERAGLEVKVNRKYYKLVEREKTVKVAGSRGQAVDQKVEKYDRQELVNLEQIQSGDLIEIELEIDSKNDYEYLVFEDMKAAGFEPFEVRSGYGGKGMRAYMELRDDRVTFFVRHLARGKHSIAYRMRAEIPGLFNALPTRGYAMYAPELKGNSDEMQVRIVDETK
ncbi:MG2 domain protein [Symmachiella dynata]|uniref:MG2 domain protein n=1 Tax=Symmachiella dynata TaxID=2527995 RepID=A0A517ZUC3_9PLAN|nr:MG2 domain protein [Symmachiella dynata]